MTHATFIALAYGAAAIVLALLIAWIVLDHRALQRALSRLEAQGVTRRSGRSAGTKAGKSKPGKPASAKP